MIADSGIGIRESSKDDLVLLEVPRVFLHGYERSVSKAVRTFILGWKHRGSRPVFNLMGNDNNPQRTQHVS